MDPALLPEALDIVAAANALPAGSDREAFFRGQCHDRAELLLMVQQIDEAPANDDTPVLAEGLDDVAPLLFPESADPDLLVGARVGPYLVEARIGEGGMGRVYRALHTGHNGTVALKVLHEDAVRGNAVSGRLRHEAELLARCKHPAIAQIFFSGTLPDGGTYFTMEYVEGLPITEYAAEYDLDLAARLRLLQSVCQAVQAAHAVGIIHRDLKPSNILVTPDGVVKLLDFGIAEVFGETGADTRTYMSAAYAAPEHNREASTHTDVYSLGVLLAELVLGRLPFETKSRSPKALRAHILRRGMQSLRAQSNSEGTPAWLRALSALRWRELDAVRARAVSTEPRERYAGVGALSADISRFLAREPVRAYHARTHRQTLYRATRFFTRHQLGVTVATVIVLLLVGLIASYTRTLKLSRDAAERDAAHAERLEAFTTGLFMDGDAPLGDNLTEEALLDRGVRQASVLDAAPDEQAELYKTLGAAYEGLGKFAKADQLLKRSWEERVRIHGPESLQAADTMMQQAALLKDENENRAALPLALHAYDIQKHALPHDNIEVLRTEDELAQIWSGLGENHKQVPLLEEAVRVEQGKPEYLADLSNAANDLSIAENNLGNMPLFFSLQRESMAIDERLEGSRHPDIAEHLLSLANGHLVTADYPAAETEGRQALSILQERLPPGHHEIAAARVQLAAALADDQKPAQALPLLEAAMQTFSAENEASSTQAFCLNTLGQVYREQKKLPQSLAAYQSALHIYQSIYPQPTANWSAPLRGIAEDQLEEHKLPAAENSARQALAISMGHQRPDDPRRITSELILARVLAAEDRSGEAGTMFQKITALGATPAAHDKALAPIIAEASDGLARLRAHAS